MAETHLFLGQTGQESQLLVDEVGGEHGVGGLHSVGCGEVVVLARVDDDAGIAVDDAGEILVNEGTLRVDVAEQNAIESVVQHHVQAFECAHSSNFRHAQT